MNKGTITIEEAKAKMARYCAYQDRSHFQVEEKLKTLSLIPEAKEQILLYLIQENFLNEERFAKNYARGKFYQKGWGKNKIKQGLQKHKIHKKLQQVALCEIDDSDYESCIEKLVEKKNINSTSKQVYRFMLQRGFDYEDFKAYLKSNN